MDRLAPRVNPAPAAKPPFYWLALALTVSMAALTVITVGLIRHHWHEAKAAGVSWESIGDTWIVSSVRPQGAAAGKLRRDDILLAINGDTRAAYLGPERWLESARQGETLQLEIVRGGQTMTIDIAIVSVVPRLEPILRYMLIVLANLAMVALLGLLRPDLATARMGFWAGLAGAIVFLHSCLVPFYSALSGWERVLGLIVSSCGPLHLAVGYHFLSLFPAPVAESRWWRILRLSIYAIAIFLRFPLLVWDLSQLAGADVRRTQVLTPWLVHIYDALQPKLFPWFWVFTCTAMLGVVIRNYRALSNEAERRRVRLAALGIAPPLVMLLVLGSVRSAAEFFGSREFANTSFYQLLSGLAASLVATAPLTMAYAILKHRLMGIRLVIRRGFQYLLTKNFLRLVLLLPVLAIAAELIANPERSLLDIFRQQSLTFIVSVSTGAGLSLIYRSRILEWVDRKFFRTVYSQEKILVELLEEIQQAESLNEISQMVANKVDAALHPKDLFIFYRADATRGFTIGYPEDARADMALQLLREREILDVLESGANAPFVVSAYAEAAGQEPLDLPQSSLVVPLTRTDQRLAGVLWLDEKRSEEPYTARDKDLLQTIAGQIAVVYENLRLKEQLADEQRVRMNVLSHLDERSVNLLKECPLCGRCYDRVAEHCAVDGTELTTPIPVERVIEKKYRLDQRLGSGGMGGVYEATDLRLNRKVALKVMVGRLFGNRTALRRFEREARTSARLRHPNIVTIHDFGRLHGEGAYLVMEYLPGVSWRVAISEQRRLPAREIAPWFDQLCSAMSVAHTAGVIHRDLKPENLMIAGRAEGQPHVTVLDFGLAKIREMEIADTHSSGLTATGVVMGTLRYMAPEQLAAKEVDPRSDIYSIGLILIETLFGGFPTKVREIYSWIETVIGSEAARNPQWKDAEKLQVLLKRVLAPDPAIRYQSVAELQADLIPLLKACPVFGPAGEPVTNSSTRTIGA